jgi:hypothetical protein
VQVKYHEVLVGGKLMYSGMSQDLGLDDPLRWRVEECSKDYLTGWWELKAQELETCCVVE